MDRHYSNLKFLGHDSHLKALKDSAVVAPVHVRIKPTNLCNHDCCYCTYRVGSLRLGEDMREADSIPPAKMMEIVDDLIAMMVRAVTFPVAESLCSIARSPIASNAWPRAVCGWRH
jgi:2-iminoacetate synthase ThiH